MAELIQYKQFEVLDPEPTGEGGKGLNRNFKTAADHDPNFIENGLALEDTAGWATYDDGAAAPVDGTGGGPIAITFNRITALQLIGDASFELSKPASDVQGEGISFDFTIDSPYQGRKFNISFAFDNQAADDVFGVYIFDIGNAVLVATDVVNLETGTGIFTAEFNTASDSTTYRLIIHTQDTNATASLLKLDAVRVSPIGESAPIVRRVSTTDATVTAIFTFAIPTDTTITIMADISGKRTDGMGRLGHRRRAMAYREGAGAAAFQGGINTPMSKTGGGAGTSGWDATFDLSGNILRVIVNGAAAQNVEWTARISLTVAP